jgi:hypothetical protein
MCLEGRSPGDEGVMDQALLRLQAAGNYMAPGTENDYKTALQFVPRVSPALCSWASAPEVGAVQLGVL